MKCLTGKSLVIDVPTRWEITFLMVQRLMELKDAVVDLSSSDVNLLDHEWEELSRLVEILRVLYDTTIALQSEKLTAGECLLEWRQVVFKLQKFGSPLTDSIIDAIQSKEATLFDSDVF